jgi:hypothetical protein
MDDFLTANRRASQPNRICVLWSGAKWNTPAAISYASGRFLLLLLFFLDMLLRVIENIFSGARRPCSYSYLFIFSSKGSTVQCPCQPINVKRPHRNDVTNLNNRRPFFVIKFLVRKEENSVWILNELLLKKLFRRDYQWKEQYTRRRSCKVKRSWWP